MTCYDEYTLKIISWEWACREHQRTYGASRKYFNGHTVTPTKFMAQPKCSYGADSWNATSVTLRRYRLRTSCRPLRRRKQGLWNRSLSQAGSRRIGRWRRTFGLTTSETGPTLTSKCNWDLSQTARGWRAFAVSASLMSPQGPDRPRAE